MTAEKIDAAITTACKVGAILLAGWFASSAFHHVKATRAEASCEHWRATIAANVAKQAIKGANSDSAPIPDIREIPKDCPRLK